MNICNHPLSDRLGGVPIVSLHTGAPLMPLSNSCAPALPAPPANCPARGGAASPAVPWRRGSTACCPSARASGTAPLARPAAWCWLPLPSPARCTDIARLGCQHPALPYTGVWRTRRWWAGSGRQLWLPNALAYAPQLGTHYTHPMTFLQRLHNSAIYLANCAVDYLRIQPILKRGWRAPRACATWACALAAGGAVRWRA